MSPNLHTRIVVCVSESYSQRSASYSVSGAPPRAKSNLHNTTHTTARRTTPSNRTSFVNTRQRGSETASAREKSLLELETSPESTRQKLSATFQLSFFCFLPPPCSRERIRAYTYTGLQTDALSDMHTLVSTRRRAVRPFPATARACGEVQAVGCAREVPS